MAGNYAEIRLHVFDDGHCVRLGKHSGIGFCFFFDDFFVFLMICLTQVRVRTNHHSCTSVLLIKEEGPRHCQSWLQKELKENNKF